MAAEGDGHERGRSRSPAAVKNKREKWKRSRSRDRQDFLRRLPFALEILWNASSLVLALGCGPVNLLL